MEIVFLNGSLGAPAFSNSLLINILEVIVPGYAGSWALSQDSLVTFFADPGR